MRESIMKFMLVTLLVMSNFAYARDCSEIDNARERLACYPRTGIPAKSGAETKPEKADQSDSLDQPVITNREPARVQQKIEKPAADRPRSEGRSGGLFDPDEKINVSSTIKELVKRDRKKMVFLLENGQIWLQTSPRILPIRVGDEVTVKNAFIGGYILRTKGGASTRVQRID